MGTGGSIAAGCVGLVAIGLGVVFVALPGQILSLPDRIPPRLEWRDDRPLSIVLLGTSLTARAIWPDGLPRALVGCLPKGLAVERVAGPGKASDWGVGMLPRVTALNPDLVILEFAVNDADLTDGLWPWDSRRNLRRIAEELTALQAAPRIILVSTAPVTGIAQHLKRPALPLYQADLARIAGERDLGFLNMTARWSADARLQTALPDGLHPDGAVEADLMLPPLTTMIGQMLGRDCGP